MEAFKAFIKPFEVPQISVKKKFKLIFISLQLSEMHRTLRIKNTLNLMKTSYKLINGLYKTIFYKKKKLSNKDKVQVFKMLRTILDNLYWVVREGKY